jgi:hypothetical protein
MKLDPLDALLARGHLSGPTRERILEAALADAAAPAAERAPGRRRWAWAAAFSAVALAGVVVLVRPAPDHMTAKGSAGSGPVVRVECSDSGSSTCGLDAFLLFRVEAMPAPGFISAYAVPRAGGERIWIFPLAGGAAAEVPAAEGPQVLPRGARARSLPPGKYDVHVALSKRPLQRAEVDTTLDVLARATSAIEVRP